jgi:signal transduction histidine kinase
VRLAEALNAGGAVISIDPGQLEQALLNIMLNARDAVAGNGNVVVSSRVRQLADDGEVIVSVVDSGAGMSDETLKRATEPLFTTKANGTGLGLATTRRIVESAGGRLTIRSRLGEGTLVELSFPRAATG